MATNAEKCRAYYERLKLDPSRHAAWLKKQAEKMRKRRAEQKGRGDNRVITGGDNRVITNPVITPEAKGGKHEASKTQGELGITAESIIEQWHSQWEAENDT